MPDRAPDHASLDREQAQKRARAALHQRARFVNYIALPLAEDLLAYEAELVRVERERDEEKGRGDAPRFGLGELLALRKALAGASLDRLDSLITETDEYESASAETPEAPDAA